MSGRLGVEIATDRLRAVALRPLGSGVARVAEVPWDPSKPRDGVTALRAALAPHDDPDSLVLAIGLGLLHVARPALPPTSASVREAMLALEPERWFVTDAPLVVAAIPGSEVALAAEAGALEAALSAFAEWAPVARCEGAPVAFARACASARRATGRFAIDAGPGESGLLELHEGTIVACRRIPGASSLAAELPPGDTLAAEPSPALPQLPGVPSTHLVALGAALGDDAGDAGVLAPSPWRARMRARARRRLGVATLAAVGAIAFAAVALDRWRERTLASLEQEAAALASEARPSLDAQARIAAVAGERAIVGARLAMRPDPAAALAAISQSLPGDAVIVSARASGDEWRIDGTARDAAALVPALDRAGRFRNVRAVSASTRFRDGARSRETFAIALTVHATP